MHTENDTITRDNTLALYGVRHRSPLYRAIQATARMVALFTALAAVVILPHVIAYTLFPA